MSLKPLNLVLIILFFATPLYADQALVLTEIEQIQEKVWYMQRDMAKQRETIENQQTTLEQIKSTARDNRQKTSELVSSLAQSVTNQQALENQAESNYQNLNELLGKLVSKVEQQDQTILQKTEKIGVLEGSLRALREGATTQQARYDQALTEIRESLLETRTQLDSLKQNTNNRVEKISLWAAGAALLVAIMLTISMVLRNKTRREQAKRNTPTRHEM